MNSPQNHSRFELHSFLTTAANEAATDPLDFSSLPWREDQHAKSQVVAMGFGDDQASAFPVGINRGKGTLRPARSVRETVAEFYLVQRRLGPALAMIPRRKNVLVNGVPALSFQVLSPRDGLLLRPGLHTYVTERFRPYVGPPTDEMLSRKMRCPCCQIPLDKSTRVVTCRCGVAYHWEDAESHPEVDADDRLDCFAQIRVCLSCKRPVTLGDSLVWDPATV